MKGRIIQTKNPVKTQGIKPPSIDPLGMVPPFLYPRTGLATPAPGVQPVTLPAPPPTPVVTPTGVEDIPIPNTRAQLLQAELERLRRQDEADQKRLGQLEEEKLPYSQRIPFTEQAPTPQTIPSIPVDAGPDTSEVSKYLPYLGLLSVFGGGFGARLAPAVVGAAARGIAARHQLERKEQLTAWQSAAAQARQANQDAIDVWKVHSEVNASENQDIADYNMRLQGEQTGKINAQKAKVGTTAKNIKTAEENLSRERANLTRTYARQIGDMASLLRNADPTQARTLTRAINVMYRKMARELGIPESQAIEESDKFFQSFYGERQKIADVSKAAMERTKTVVAGNMERAKLSAETQKALQRMQDKQSAADRAARVNMNLMDTYQRAIDNITRNYQAQLTADQNLALGEANRHMDIASSSKQQIMELYTEINQNMTNAAVSEMNGQKEAANSFRAQASAKTAIVNSLITEYNREVKATRENLDRVPQLEDDPEVQQLNSARDMQWAFLESVEDKLGTALPKPNRPAATPTGVESNIRINPPYRGKAAPRGREDTPAQAAPTGSSKLKGKRTRIGNTLYEHNGSRWVPVGGR